MSSGYKVVDEEHVGGQEGVASEWETIRAVFHNFADLPSERDDHTESKVFKWHGLEWYIELYPGGSSNSSEDDIFVSMYLYSKSCETNNIKAKSRIRVPSAGWAKGGSAFRVFSPACDESCWGFKNYAKREDILDPSNNYLVDGNLTVEFDIQVMLDEPPTWTPTNTIIADMLKLLDDTDNADVLFDIAEGNSSKEQEEAHSPRTFYAHRSILSVRCPALAVLAEDCDPATPIPIVNVQADVFRMLLRFIYGGEIPSKNIIKDQAKDIIHAADKYGCTGLKLAAESEVAAADITIENTAELILFADATNCAMLKEAAMEYFVANAQEVMASEGFVEVKESPSVMAELMDVAFGGCKKRPADDSTDANDRDYKRMRVAELRRELDSKGLDVDGSKEMISSRLKAADEEERKKNSITVSGAGLGDVNGVYNKTSELFDGLPVYQKIGLRTWQGMTGRFCLFRHYVISDGRKKWFISFVLDGTRPGTEDIDFYFVDPDDNDDGGGDDDNDDDDNDNDTNLPPEDGWKLDEEGLDPSPTVQKGVEE